MFHALDDGKAAIFFVTFEAFWILGCPAGKHARRQGATRANLVVHDIGGVAEASGKICFLNCQDFVECCLMQWRIASNAARRAIVDELRMKTSEQAGVANGASAGGSPTSMMRLATMCRYFFCAIAHSDVHHTGFLRVVANYAIFQHPSGCPLHHRG